MRCKHHRRAHKRRRENKMVDRIFPPNNTMGRALFCWQKSELDSSQERAVIASFCEQNKITTLLVHFWSWLGSTNWSANNVSNLISLIDKLNDVGVGVWGLIGNVDYAVNQNWVRENIIGAVQEFNSHSQSHKLEGLVYDNEYWTNPTQYPSSSYIPGYWSLMEASRSALQIPIGVFAQRSLLDSSPVSCRGLNDSDGAHLVAMSDVVFVGSYDEQAEPHGGYPGQIAMIEPWIDKAEEIGKGTMIWGCSETKNVSPSWISYYGKTKAQMEAQHDLIANALSSDEGSPYVGQAVHDYTAYKNM